MVSANGEQQKDRYESVSGKGYKSKKPVKKRKRNKPVFSNLKNT